MAYRPDPAGDIVLGSATITGAAERSPRSGPDRRPVPEFAWPAGAATGIGSLPGTDIAEAQRIVLGELPDLPHLRRAAGPGTGRRHDRPRRRVPGRPAGRSSTPAAGGSRRAPAGTCAAPPTCWNATSTQLTDQAGGYTGPLKVQAAGPWTLAANVDLPIGGRLLRDPGAVRDLTDSLAEGLRRHVGRRAASGCPARRSLLQLDEPSLPAVLAGRVPTESGLSAYRPVDAPDAADALRTVVDRRSGVPVVVHCCAADVPLPIVRDAGAAAVSLDLALLTDLDPLGEALDAGLGPVRRGRAHAAGIGRSRAERGRHAHAAAVGRSRADVRGHRRSGTGGVDAAGLPAGTAAPAGGGHPRLRPGRRSARVRPRGADGVPRGRPPPGRRPLTPRSWSCGCPYAAFVRFRANHNSKIAGGSAGPEVSGVATNLPVGPNAEVEWWPRR